MATTVSKTPLLKTVASRGYAVAQAAASRSADVQTTTLKNKLVVATAESNSSLSKISVVFNAGARNETYDQLGATHVIRNAAVATNANATNFGIVSQLASTGSDLIVTNTRETLSFTADLNRENLESGLKILLNLAFNQNYRPWEFKEIRERVAYETRLLPNVTRAVEALHLAAFRNGLGNSLYAAENRLLELSADNLQNFVETNFNASNAAIVGVGIEHSLLLGIASHLELRNNATPVNKSKFLSNSARYNETSSWATVAIGTEGAARSNPKEALAFAVLQQVAGVNGSPNSGLGKAVGSALGKSQHAVSALNASYADTGLFGAVLVAEASQIGKAVEAAVKAIKSGSVSANDLARAKEQLKSSVLENSNTDSGLVAELGTQCATIGGPLNASDVVASIDALTSDDVNAAAKKVASGKWSIGAVGNLANVPYPEQL